MLLEFIYAAVLFLAGFVGLVVVVLMIAAATVFLHKD